MKLYHTGPVEIRTPDPRHGRINADFGQGFYLTPDADFTWRWARKDDVVNTYEMDLSGLDVHQFTKSPEWFDYICRNRRAQDALDVDVVIGPIANDTIFDTFGIITSGWLKPGDALSLLAVGPEYTQVALKTERAVAQLRWLGARVAEDIPAHRDALAQEIKDYNAQLAVQLEHIAGVGKGAT